MKLALVTGGCRRIGAVIAARLAGAGYELALHSHGEAVPEEALQAALEVHAVKWQGFPCELSDADAVEALMPRVVRHFGRWPDLLVNNASMFEDDTATSITAKSLHRHYAVNLVAPALLAKAMAEAPAMESARLIVNILDQRIAHPPLDQLSYTLSKIALSSLTEINARAFGPHLRVCGIAPGLTLPTSDYTADQMKRVAQSMPLARLAAPEDIARAVLYLVENQAMTGQILFIDGGAHLKGYDRDFVFMQS